MRVRCFLIKYGDGSELLRWFLPEKPDGWAQQVGVMRLHKETGYEDTSSNPWEVMYMPGFKELLETGLAEELT
jgi:hypothetical protein